MNLNNNAEVQSHWLDGKIYTIRGKKVMIDRDLAALYGVETKRLNEQVRRNIMRFPDDFMFQLSKEECLRSQIATLNTTQGQHLKYLSYAFTENGIAMLSSVLRSETAIEVNIRIMRTFVAMRTSLSRMERISFDIEYIRHRITNLNNYVETILSDQNDINEDTARQLQRIQESLADLHARNAEVEEFDKRKKIGFSDILLLIHCVAQQELELVDVLDRGDLTFLDEGDAAGLFGYYDHVGVGLFRDSDGGLVAHAVVGRDVCPFGDREGAAGCHYPVAGNHHCAVVKRRVLEEEIHDQSAVDSCVYPVSGADDFIKRSVMCDHDKRSGLVLRHSAAGLCEVVHGLASDGVCSLSSQDPVHDGTSLCAVHVSVAEPDEEFPDFRLEDDDQGYDSHIQHHVHDGRHQPHVECLHHDPDDVERHDGHEYAHRRRTFDPSEHEEDDQSQKDDVENVRKGQLKEAEKRQNHIPYYYIPANLRFAA